MYQKSCSRRALLGGARAVSVAVLAAFTLGSSLAQQITGTPGSPSATTTIDGKYLPNPPAPFGGTINLNAKEFQTVLATDRGAAQGCAQRLADHDR